MKKTGILKAPLWSAATVLLFLSCASGSGGGSWKAYPESPALRNYRPGDIRVTVDHVPEEGVASQIRVIAETLLAGGAREEEGAEALIDIRVEQRSFLHEVELLNTIYVDCLVRGEAGETFGREYEYTVGRGSILSAREQERLIRIVLKRILKNGRRLRKNHA
jgi:hypothetical protein